MPNRARLARLARLASVERQASRPAEPPTVVDVLTLRPSDAPEYAALPAWACCHSDGSAHVDDGPHVCPLSTPGAPAHELPDAHVTGQSGHPKRRPPTVMSDAHALAIVRRARALGAL